MHSRPEGTPIPSGLLCIKAGLQHDRGKNGLKNLLLSAVQGDALQAAVGINGLVWAQPAAELLSTARVIVLYLTALKKMQSLSVPDCME